MGVEQFVVTSTEAYGTTHEVLNATVSYAVDPADSAHKGIVDLDRVETDSDGLVRFTGDARLMRPLGDGNGLLLVIAANRGKLIEPLGGVQWLAADGWTVAWCGWQWDVPRGPGFVGLDAPEATEGGVPVGSPVRIEVLTDVPRDDHKLADATGDFTRYRVADPDEPGALLTERDWWDGPRRVVDRSRWGFGRVVDGSVVPDDEHVWLEGGFRPGVYHEVIYRSSMSPVTGVGHLAFRDLGAHLRDLGGHPHVFALGSSQAGRYLRQWLFEGLNLDETGRQVYDGVLAGVAGGRRDESNHRGAQPALMYPVGFSTLPPFDHEGLLARQRALGGVPRVVFTNTGWEYWLGDAGLTHLDDAGADLAECDDVRSWYFAGIDHYGDHFDKRSLPLANPPNPLGSGLLSRAAFENLVRWVREGVAPPPSCVPRFGDGTAATRVEVLKAMPAIPGATPVDADALPWLRAIDLGPDADKGVARWPAVETDAYPDVVSAVDDDGNELAGVRLPQLAVPVGTFTGWNPRRPAEGLPATPYARAGSFWPFARTREERLASGDPRPSLAERYRDPDDYEARVRSAVEALVADRFLRPEDAETAVAAALKLYDDVLEDPAR